MSLTIYTYPGNPRVQRALIAAEYNGVKVEVPAFQFGVDNKTPEFLAKFPVGKVPAMDTPQGPLYESGAIARYIAKLNASTQLLGSSYYQQGQVDQWIDYLTLELQPAIVALAMPILGYAPFDQKVYDEAKKDLLKHLAILDKHFLRKTYMVGEQITLADITAATALVFPFTKILVADVRAKFPNVMRWFETCVNQPQFSKVLGKIEYAVQESKPAGAPAPAAKATEKKAEKPASEPIDLEAAPKKTVTPYDEMPPTTMVLDSVKREHFNVQPFNKTFFDTFWSNFDAEGYCFYRCQYKYNEDFSLFFLACNLLGGFLQRAEIMRKYAFAAMALTGESEDAKPWVLEGVWMFRGKEINPFFFQQVDDAEGYNWTKLDTSNPADQATIKAFFQGEQVDGRNILERRYFK